MKVPLEDTFADVIGKATTGLGLNPTALSRQTGLSPSRLEAILDGTFDSGIVSRLAAHLNLHAPSLFEMAKGAWYPDPVELTGLAAFNTPFPVRGYEEMTVNSYLIWDPTSRKAAAFDTGANVDGMLEVIQKQSLSLSMVCLTHTHDDHVAALQPLLEATGHPPVYANAHEPYKGAELFEPGQSLFIGYLQIETCHTSGHSPGGTTYVISGLERPVAVVGDALFCCSQGGAHENYKEALANNRRHILSLPDETVICPGHGPMTSVAEEKQHNPFFAESD
jgi:glyoxylase-like metal-dependent hydrolase (beta-lactamase superfamily II)